MAEHKAVVSPYTVIPYCSICHLIMPCLDGAILRYPPSPKAPLTVNEIRERLADGRA
jgi:hypothetical protein